MAAEAKAESGTKKESPIIFVAMLAVTALIAIGAGWFLAGRVEAPAKVAEIKETDGHDAGASDNDADATGGHAADANSDDMAIYDLDPIIVNLAGAENSWLRLELALVADDDANIAKPLKRMKLNDEFIAFLRTLRIDQLSGPSSYIHLREDLLDRARLSTGEDVHNILVKSMVVE